MGIRNELDKLALTQAWSLRETDLYDFQRQLDKIDESRVDGNWLDEDGQPADLYVQRVNLSQNTKPARHLLTSETDTSLLNPEVLRLHLSSHDLFGTCVRGATPGIQSTNNAETLPHGGEK